MISRRHFLASGATVAVAGPGLLTGATEPVVRIGLVADAQYADADPALNRSYRDAIPRLRAAVEHFNRLPLDFCLHLGDLIDRDWSSFEAIFEPLSLSRHRFHQLLGNHDFEVADACKTRVPGRMGMERRHFWIDSGGFRFVLLDSTEISTYAHRAGSVEEGVGVAELRRHQAEGRLQAQPWNSGMGAGQLAWFEAACRDAGKSGLRVMVFAHHPVLPEGGYNIWNNEALLAIIDRHRHVVGWFNGHHHAGAFAERGGAFFVTLCGMVETLDTNAYAVAHLYADRVELIGHGRERSRELRFRSH
jgi:3',5'-cyclic AMP phosphodiesterase CpdA